MTNRRSATIALVLVAFMGWVAPLRAAEIEGVSFPDEVRPRGVNLHLHRTALLRYKVLFRGYVAALYLPPGTSATRVLDDVPKRLEISYFWSIAAGDFVQATKSGIAANVAPKTLAALADRIDRFNALYGDVRPGDRYALTYVPGVGTELALNGTVRGTIPGDDFASAVFGIWFGPKPFDEGFKRELLAPS